LHDLLVKREGYVLFNFHGGKPWVPEFQREIQAASGVSCQTATFDWLAHKARGLGEKSAAKDAKIDYPMQALCLRGSADLPLFIRIAVREAPVRHRMPPHYRLFAAADDV
jgi:hypothetical protein